VAALPPDTAAAAAADDADADDAERWLLAHRHGTPAATALDFVDRLPGVPLEAMTGRWCGAGWHTGHPWDGLLEA
jgi:GXWXG protein